MDSSHDREGGSTLHWNFLGVLIELYNSLGGPIDQTKHQHLSIGRLLYAYIFLSSCWFLAGHN